MNSKKGAADEIQRLNWIIKIRTVVMLFEFIVIIILAGLSAYLFSLPKKVPWVVELTSDGEATYKADVVTALSEWTPSDATQRFFISKYIQELRGISTDNNVNKQNVQSVYSRSLNDASTYVDQYYRDNNPITRSKNEYIVIPTDEMAVVKYSANQWKVTWRETSYRVGDKEIFADYQCEAVLTVSFYLPDTERRRRENPIGMYISKVEIVYERSLI